MTNAMLHDVEWHEPSEDKNTVIKQIKVWTWVTLFSRVCQKPFI